MLSIFNLESLEWRLKRIESKLSRLMEHAGIEDDPIHPIPGVSKEAAEKITAFILDNKKIPAIKEYRNATGAPLREAKTFIDSLYRKATGRG